MTARYGAWLALMAQRDASLEALALLALALLAAAWAGRRYLPGVFGHVWPEAVIGAVYVVLLVIPALG